MAKALIFIVLWQILGNPFLAVLVLLIILYLLDRRFLGVTPSFLKPLKRRSRISKLKQKLLLNPNDTGSKQELARLLLEKKDFKQARDVLESIGDILEHSAEYWDDFGTALLRTGERERGEASIRRALSINPRVKYGAPYLRLASMHANRDTDMALACLQEFRNIHSSSSEAYYRMGRIYLQLGRKDEARSAFKEAIHIYRSLPNYKKREERRWAYRSLLMKNRA